ncbi:putative pectate lyase 2 [Elaeis guineensis]|uniref:putative pectate lyase 2 n=1 Tax=Elaeis guineensis var. tenera TaxID=51953 RepID=UPI003C6D62EA
MALRYPLAPYLFFSLAFVPLYAAACDNSTTGDSQPHHCEKIMNQIDACWRCDPGWASNRKLLADCAVGFGKGALGGKNGTIYTVTDPSDNATNPKPGTLRYGAIQTQPLWIVFKKDMVIRLESELFMNSFKTIDGRGAKVAIADGPCIRIQQVNHIIIHGLGIHNCTRGRPGMVRISPTVVEHWGGHEGDAITIFASSHVWIDHCNLSHSTDGLIDVVHGSTAVTISNNFFSDHDKVMLLGHKDGFDADKVMKVTVVFNHFGPNLVQRMPRVRTGYAHVASNRYDGWELYAIGGSSNPTILSEGNYYHALDNPQTKEVTQPLGGGSQNWEWRSSKDYFLNGAYFVSLGSASCAPNYFPSQKFQVAEGSKVPSLTADSGTLSCVVGEPCI